MSWLSESGVHGLSIPMMNPLRTILASAEQQSRLRLSELLAKQIGLTIVAECANSTETVTAIRRHRPDLAVLDVPMTDGDLAQVMRMLPEEDLPSLILTGASEREALLAFEVRALDFLIQPIEERRLQAAVERVRMRQLQDQDRSVRQRVLNLLAANDEPAKDRRLAVKVGGRVLLLEVDQIDWIQASGNYVKIKVGPEHYTLREGIGRIAQRLDSKAFVRIHRSIIVNAQRIRELQPCNSGEYMVVLKDGKELSCSRGYRSNLRRFIAAY
jgi:two-component system, LytTR family, response regulator